jgi:ferredoxin-NADP reductase
VGAAAVFKSHLLGKTPGVADVVTFRFERPPGYEYLPGQWFVITLPGPDGPLDHHFSHSSSPTEPRLEFTTRLRDSEFKLALRALEMGAEVELESPYGAFTLAPGTEPVVFLAGGIGITCVRSILRSCADNPADIGRREITLIFANRSEDAIPFQEELAAMQAELPGLRVVHVISSPGEGWGGYRGHVSADILDRELSLPAHWTYYASGPPGFVGAMRELLETRGVGGGHVKVERFDGYE